jgi:hypothetical protein
MSLAAEVAYGVWVMIETQGALCSYTRVTTIAGSANPAPNPPTLINMVVSDNPALMGATTIDFSASVLTGRLVAGDSFMVPGDPTVYTVDSEAISPVTSQTLTGVSFSPPLAEDVPQGTIPTFTYAATFPLLALITDFPQYLINGTSITEKDHRMRFLATDALPGAPANCLPNGVTPAIGDLVTLPDGTVYKVTRTTHLETQGVHYGWALQVRQ